MDTYKTIAREISLLKSFDKVWEIKSSIKTSSLSEKEKAELYNHLNYHIEYTIKSAHKRATSEYLQDFDEEEAVVLPRSNKYKSVKIFVDGYLYSIGDKFNLESMKTN